MRFYPYGSFSLAIFFALLLGGCASLDQKMASIHSASSIKAPAVWSTTRPEIRSKTPEPQSLVDWWRQLGDIQLEQLISEAMIAAPDIRSVQARLRQSRALRELAVANLFPSLGASMSASRSRAGTEAGGNNKVQTLYASGFDASWEPSMFGGLRDAADAALADAESVEASLDSTRASLAAEVALNYVNLRASQRRLEIVQANIASQDETLQIAEWREMAGLVTRLDVEQARTNLEQSRAALPSLESTRAEAEHRLAILTGRVPGSLRETLGSIRPLPIAPEEIAVGIPAEALRQRPDVRAAEFTLKAEVARTAEREADRYPSLSLNGSLAWKSFSLATLGGGDGLVRSLAASLAGTLFDAGRIRNRIAVQNAVQEQALVAYEKSLLTALEDVENAMTAYVAGRQRVEARRKAETAAANAAQLARTQYQAGATDFQKVLETERTLLSAQDSLASAEADVLIAVIQLYKALGGGWQTSAEKS